MNNVVMYIFGAFFVALIVGIFVLRRRMKKADVRKWTNTSDKDVS